ncbi:unnamed protein product [Parajaminaea phylloscopi]
MSRLRPFQASDLFKFNRVNLDHFTETYSTSYYLSYLSYWPELCFVATPVSEGSFQAAVNREDSDSARPLAIPAPFSSPQGYLFGKAEGKNKERHGHVTAVTVAPEYRRLGLAKDMMDLLEQASSQLYDAYFVDLFVRPSNALAVGLYEALQYSIYRRVKEYYQGGGKEPGQDEDGYDMRKALARDVKRETVRESKNGINVVVDVQATLFPPTYRT